VVSKRINKQEQNPNLLLKVWKKILVAGPAGILNLPLAVVVPWVLLSN
jgi:hypothetical protein